jgi:enamine deaminase RidA (YjgF/YER057c/UK114 family)
MRACLPVLLVLGATLPAVAQPERPIRIRPEKKEPVTQALEVIPDPPHAIAAETARLVFHVSPLSGKGLLTQQVRDALRAIDRANGNATLVKIRAFVAGSGDMRRVQAIVSEDFTAKRIPLPAVSTVQVGGLPMEGAQVVIEAVSQARRAVNPNGLAFFSGVPAKDLPGAVKQLQDSVRAAGVKPESVLRITCFLQTLNGLDAARAQVSSAFPAAAANFVQLTRLGMEPLAACEGAGRLTSPPSELIAVRGAAALVRTPKLVFTGIQMAFGGEDSDLRLGVDRLRKALDAAGAGAVVFLSSYPLSAQFEQRLQALHAEAFRPVPAGTSLLFEGLPSLDATVAIEAIAAAR